MTSSLLADPALVPPRLRLVPDAVDTEGPAACFLAQSYGLTPRPFQHLIVGDWLAVRAGGRWASARNGLSLSRQNGKNATIEIRELFGLVALGERVIHTAHEVKTARKAFRRLLEFFDSDAYPELKALVSEVRRTNGQEAISLTNGGQVEFIARSRGSGRGYSGDLLIVDEAQAATDDELAALLPILATSLNPQLILTGTPPGPREPGQVFRRFRSVAIAGEDPAMGWSEWSAEPGDDFTDRGLWHSTNPELGGLLMLDTVEGEFQAMDLEYFARERLGVWSQSAKDAGVIDPLTWSLLAADVDAPTSPCFAVEVTPDRTRSMIGAAWLVDGKPHVELVQSGPGVDWVLPRLAELALKYRARTVALDAGTAAWSLADGVEAARLTVVKVAGAGRPNACAALYDAASTAALTHDGSPELAAAVAAAKWKTVGEGARVFTRRGSAADISALYAVTLALHGLTTTAAAPSRFFML